ncbi:MAG: hypothetical protein ACJ73S_11035 [Mycobacteriales bacterium]
MNDRPALAFAERAADWLIGLRAAERADDLSLDRGTAGVLVFFLHAARAYDEPRDLAQACAAGDVLAAAVRDHRPEVDGDPDGVLFALRELAATTGEARYAAAARALAGRVATGAGRTLPVPRWEAVGAEARALLEGGIPAAPGRDGGCAGVADRMLTLHHQAVAGYPVGDPAELLAFARTLTADLLDRAVVDAGGAHWLPPETGWARGAAGIGSWLVRLDTFEQGRESVLALPGDPW